jgi:hypothetical protein
VRAFYALQGEYIGEITASLGGGPKAIHVKEVSGEARRVVGQWQTADSLVTQLTKAFAAATDREGDPEQKSRLRKFAVWLGGAARDIAVNVCSQVVEAKVRQIGL